MHTFQLSLDRFCSGFIFNFFSQTGGGQWGGRPLTNDGPTWPHPWTHTHGLHACVVYVNTHTVFWWFKWMNSIIIQMLRSPLGLLKVVFDKSWKEETFKIFHEIYYAGFTKTIFLMSNVFGTFIDGKSKHVYTTILCIFSDFNSFTIQGSNI